jgi:uncharacterized protein YndB with AHSA1/START domain
MLVDNQQVERSSRQQIHIEAPPDVIWALVGDPNRHPDWWPDVLDVECADLREGCRYRGVTKGPLRTAEHELMIERLQECREVSIVCVGTGVTTRFELTDAQGGTFVEGYFAIEPNSIGNTMLAALAGRRLMRSWLEQSLANLKQAAERAPAPS